MKCPSCNAELPSTARFCGACGTTLSSPPQPEQQPAEPPPLEQNWAPPPAQGEAWPATPQPGYATAGSYNAAGIPPVEKRFKALRFIAVLLKIFAFVAGALLVIGGLVMIVAGAVSGSASRTSSIESVGPQMFGGFVGGLLMMIYGAFVFVFLYGYAEVIYLFLGIEENTRVTNEMLRNR